MIEGAAHSPRWVLELARAIKALPLKDQALEKAAETVLFMMGAQAMKSPRPKEKRKREALDPMAIPPWREPRAMHPGKPRPPPFPPPARRPYLVMQPATASRSAQIPPPVPLAPGAVSAGRAEESYEHGPAADHDPYELFEADA